MMSFSSKMAANIYISTYAMIHILKDISLNCVLHIYEKCFTYFQLLESEKPDEEALRKQHEALEISMNAQEQLTAEKFENFCKIVVNDSLSNKRKFMELHTLVAGKMDLQEMLLDLLSAGEALELGTDVYQQYCIRDAMKRFFRKVRIFYANKPSEFTKILKEFQASLANPDVKPEEVLAFGQKYFKSNQVSWKNNYSCF